MLFIKAAILAIICGITEFLPVSSNGHVIILKELMGFEGPAGKMFELSLQLGAISAVCWLFRNKLIRTVVNASRNRTDRQFAIKLGLAFLPAAVFGFIFHHYITEHLFNARVVSVSLVIGGIAILLVEKYKPSTKIANLDDIPVSTALAIGLFQTLSLIPGVSRSGATIMGALIVGVERKVATEFSFFLAIPIIFVAGFYDIFKHRHELTSDSISLLVLGFCLAFVCALVVVKWLLGYLTRHGFIPFAWYRIIVGSLVFALLMSKAA